MEKENWLEKQVHAVTPVPANFIGKDAEKVSTHLWKIRWQDYFPVSLEETGISVHPSSLDEFLAFLKQEHTEVFRASPSEGKRHPFLSQLPHPAKEAYYRLTGDFFTFREGSKIVGVFLSTPSDWGTYYLRYTWVLPEYRGRRFYQKFLAYLLSCLEEKGVERAEADVSPANPVHLHVFSKLLFKVTGLTLSERWGTLMRLTYFMSEKHEAVFSGQFLCSEF